MALQDKVEKRGWLKKQGGIVKSWQMRWFVLQGMKLHYYTKDDESKHLGTIELSGNKLVEVPFDRDDPDKWMLDIVPGKGGKMTTTHDSYPLCAASEQERSDWMAALRRCMYRDKGGGVFGTALQEVMEYDADHFGLAVPHIVAQCIEVILKDGKEVEGIFRLSGRLSQVKELRRKYDEGERPDLLKEEAEIHSIASLLKLYFRELPEPVIPFKHFEAFLNLATSFRYNSNYEKTMKQLKELVHKIPKHNLNLLQYLTNFLNEISKFQEVNKMTEKNISLIFGTNILRSEDTTPEFQMATQNLTTHVVLALVKWHDLVFSDNDNARLDEKAFQQLVSLSEVSPTSMEETALYPAAEELISLSCENPESIQEPVLGTHIPDSVVDLAGIDFTALDPKDGVALDKPNVCPPPISKRSKVNDAPCINPASPVDSSKTIIEETRPAPAPRNKALEMGDNVVVRRIRPTPLDRAAAVKPIPPINKVNPEPSNFRSHIDGPMDPRFSLNIGDLPSSVEDLQALVLSLKLQVKELRHVNDKLCTDFEITKQNSKKREDNLASKISEEREAKDNALNRIMELTNKLVQYQSMYGPISE